MQDRLQTQEAKLDEVRAVLRRLQHIESADEADSHAPTQSEELQRSPFNHPTQARVAIGVGLVLFAGLAGVAGTALRDMIVHFGSSPAIQTSLARKIGWVSPSELEDRLAWQRSNDLAPYKDWISPALLREKLEEQSSNLAKKYEGWVSPSELIEKLRSEQLSVEIKYKDWVAPDIAMDRLLQQRKEISDRYEGSLSSTEMTEKITETDAAVRSEFKGWVSPEEMAKAVDSATSSLRQELQLAKADLEQTGQATQAAQAELQEANAKQHFDEAGDDPCKKLQYVMWQSSCYLGPIDGHMSLETIRSVDQYFGSIGAKAPGRKYFWKNFGTLDDPVARGKVHALCQSDLQLKGRVCSPAVGLRDLRDSMGKDPDDNSADSKGLIDWNDGTWIIRGRFPTDGSGKTSISLKWRRGAKIASLKISSITGSVQCVDIREADGRGLGGKGRDQKKCDDPGEWFRVTIEKLNANELTLGVERKPNSKDPNYILFLSWPI